MGGGCVEKPKNKQIRFSQQFPAWQGSPKSCACSAQAQPLGAKSQQAAPALCRHSLFGIPPQGGFRPRGGIIRPWGGNARWLADARRKRQRGTRLVRCAFRPKVGNPDFPNRVRKLRFPALGGNAFPPIKPVANLSFAEEKHSHN